MLSRAKQRRISAVVDGPLYYAVYLGNFPQVVRDALKLRTDEKGQPLWIETEPNANNMMGIDFVWKPINF
jgi:hypothetical protein